MIDPTMTSGLRRAFTAELRRQFSGLKLDIVRYFEGEDFQRGLSFNTPSVDYFSSWLQSRLQERLTGPRQERLWEMLVEESFRRGAGRAYDDVVPRDFSRTKSDLDQASRAGFVRAIMGIGVQSLEIPLTANAFCPTGEGGGIDNSCPPTRSGSDSVQDPPVIDLEVYRGGGDKEGELVTYFTTRQDMAESYVDMYNDRYGAGGKLHKKSLSILSPARQDIIFSTAVSIGFDEDDITSGTPATIFDQEIHGRDKVKKLVDTLRKSGHDGAILDDIAYGKNIQDKAYIKFSNPEPKNQIPQVRLKKGQRLTALPKDGIRPLGSGMYIYTSGGASYQLKKLGNGKYLVTGARLTTNALPFFSGARRAFDSVKLLAQRAWTEFVGGVQGLANGLARTFLDGRVRDAKPQAVAREMSKQVERARIQSTTVVSDSVVRAFNEGILVAAIPLGVTEIGVAVEWRVRRNPDGSIAKNVCRACRDLEGVVLRPSEAKGLFPRHPRCQCSLVAITKASKDQKTSRGSVVSAIQRSRRRYKSAKAREWASRVKISERRPKLTKNVLVERIDRMLTGNVFCPTGQGGGVDPTCSPGGSAVHFGDLSKDVQTRISVAPWDSLNPELRDPTLIRGQEFHQDRVRKTDELFKHAVELRRPEKFIRGVSGTVYPMKAGETFTEPGYLRLSNDQSTAEGFTERPGKTGQVLHLTVPKGSRVLPGDHVREHEIYLPRGASFRVTRVESKENDLNIQGVMQHIHHIHAELVTSKGVNNSLALDSLQKRPTGNRDLIAEFSERIENVFCPTGPGGGVDPSCSPSAKIQKELDRVSSSFSSSPLTDAEDRMVYDWKTGNSNLLDKPEFIAAVEKGVVEKDVTVYRAGGLSSTKALEFTTRESWAKDTAEAQDRSVITIHLKKGDRALFVPLATRHHIVEVGVLLPPSTMRKYENVTNVFCPTGPGGGVDPTCSPNGHRILRAETETSVLPPEEKSKDEAVIRESYIKDAKDMADSSYTQELVDRVKSKMAMHDERWSETHAQVMKLADKEDSLREKHVKETSKLDKMMEANLKAKNADKDWPHSEEDINKQAEKCDEALTKYFKHRNAMADKSWDVIRKSVSNEQRRFDGHYSTQEVKIHIDPNINDHIPSAQVTAEVEKVNARLSKCISQEYERRINHLTTVKAIPAGQTQRAHFSGSIHKGTGDHGEIFIGPFDKAGVIAHELGHSLEMDLNTHLAARGFLYHRVGKEVAVPTGSEHWEVGRTDNFGKAFESSASYVGKHYKTPDTEIVSMGLQKLYEEPHFLAKHDPEYFKFMLGILDGSFR